MDEVHSKKSSVVAKRLWNFVRVAFFMMRKGLISKKKLLMNMNLFFKRGRLIRKTVSNLLSHHHHHHQMTRGGFSNREYEFSCSNSPNPVFFRKHNHNHNHHHHHHIHFPCINTPHVLDEVESPQIDHNAIVLVPKTPEYTFNLHLEGYNLAPGENYSPLRSPFPIKISDYLSEDDETDNNGGNIQVDHEAEEFINQFYEQLRAQSRVQLLQY